MYAMGEDHQASLPGTVSGPRRIPNHRAKCWRWHYLETSSRLGDIQPGQPDGPRPITNHCGATTSVIRRKQIQILRSQPGVVYDEIDRTIQLTASSPSQLLERAHQLVQVTYGDPDPIPVTGQTVKQQIQDYVRMYA